MKKSKVLKKGGIDTILAYIVVSIPLFSVLIFVIATLYHFSVQMHVNQTVKETLIMASSYGTLTSGMVDYLFESIDNVDTTWKIRVGRRSITEDGEITDYKIWPESGEYYTNISGDGGSLSLFLDVHNGPSTDSEDRIKKGDLLSIELISEKPSLLGNVANFSAFGSDGSSNLVYSSYREEIMTNVNPYDT